MKTEEKRLIWVKIVPLKIGDVAHVSVKGQSIEDIQAEAESFCKARNLICDFEKTATGVQVTRVAEREKISLYPDIDALEVGQSTLFELPYAMHQKIRMAAGHRAKTGKIRLSCNREGDFIRVTRLPMTEDEAATCGPIKLEKRPTKYGMERLGSEHELRFEVPKSEHDKVRLAAHRFANQTGWRIRCRIQDDGSMLVYRVAEAAAAE